MRLFCVGHRPHVPPPQHAHRLRRHQEGTSTPAFSWAVMLSGIPAACDHPYGRVRAAGVLQRERVPPQGGRVWGWYPNTGHDVVYVHEAVRELMADGSDQRSLLAASIIVHEFTHYLQAANRGFAAYRCGDNRVIRARGVWRAKRLHRESYGRYSQVGVSMHNAGCGGSASESAVPLG